MANAYLDHFTYLRSPSGLETASLLGNSARLSGAHIMGATTLTITPATTVDLKKNDRITIFDGSNSESVIVSGATNQPASNIPVSATTFAHADATALCSDGPLGSLADEIIAASTWAENICNQSLFQQTYTNEGLRMPSMRASIDNEGRLLFRPRHFPVTADTGITIKQNNVNPVSYDATQIILDGAQMVVTVPWLIAGGGQGGSTYSLLTTPSRSRSLMLQITYTAGFPYSSMPADIRDSCVLLTSDLLSRRQNPTGAFNIQLGHKRLVVGAATDTSGDSALVKKATQILQYYSAGEIY